MRIKFLILNVLTIKLFFFNFLIITRQSYFKFLMVYEFKCKRYKKQKKRIFDSSQAYHFMAVLTLHFKMSIAHARQCTINGWISKYIIL